jgi:hypothetical protein
MTEEFAVTFGGHRWGVASDVAMREHWEHWAQPFFRVDDADRLTSRNVEVRATRIGDAPRDAERIVLHGEHGGAAWWDDDVWHVRHSSLPVVYSWSASLGRQILCFDYDRTMPANDISLDVFRVVRGLLCAEPEVAQRSRAHMAVVARGDVAIAFVGDKGAGKTSFSLSLLDAHPAVGFVTNDKAQIEHEDGRVMVHGLPLAAAIGLESVPSMPALTVDGASRVIDGKLYLWPQDLAGLMGKRCVASAPLGLVCACELDLAAHDAKTAPIDHVAAQDYVTGPVSQYTDRINPDWLIRRVFGVVPKDVPKTLLDVPWVRVRGNPWTNSWPTVFEDLVERHGLT